MKRLSQFLLCLVFLSTTTAQAVITTTGDIDPTDPTTWTDSTIAYVGKTSDGTLTVDDGSEIVSREGYLGYAFGATGTVNISGTGSKWDNTGGGTYPFSLTKNNSIDVLVWRDKLSPHLASTKLLACRETGQIPIGFALPCNTMQTGSGSVYTARAINITDGRMVDSDVCSIGYAFGSMETVHISSAGSTWIIPIGENENHSLYVGREGYGQMNLSEGGTVTSNDASIGHASRSTGMATVAGTGSIWTNDGYLYVGREGSGQLSITDGGAVSSDGASTGHAFGAKGIVNVSGTGSVWTIEGVNGLVILSENTSDLYIGREGDGQMNITDGGRVTGGKASIGDAFGATGSVTVTGAGSSWSTKDQFTAVFYAAVFSDETTHTSLYVGRKGTGQLDINEGATVKATGCSIGHAYGAKGTVNVSGAGSIWKTNVSYQKPTALYVGREGDGQMNITNGGGVDSKASSIGYAFGASGTVSLSGAGSTWNNLYQLDIGQNGTGQLSITDGATLNSGNSSIGSAHFSSGTVVVAGSGSTWNNNGTLYVAKEGTAQLTIANNAEVHVSKKTWVGADAQAIGTISFDSGKLTTLSLAAGTSNLRGTGTIDTQGLLSDTELRFNATNGSNQTVVLNARPDQNITIHLNQTADGDLGAGYRRNGTLAIEEGVAVRSDNGYLGYHASAAGTATVAGSGSSWTIEKNLYIGYDGVGHLNLLDAGAVNVGGQTWVGHYNPAGTIHFDNATLTTGGLHAATSDLTGVGTIHTNGLVSDIDLRFDSNNGLEKNISLNNQSGQPKNITIHLTQSHLGDLGAGHKNNSTLTIADGVMVTSHAGYLGQHFGSNGTATVTGNGSYWQNYGALYVAYQGAGELSITDGGKVDSFHAYIAYGPQSNGKVTVSGAGSIWNSNRNVNGTPILGANSDLYIGYEGIGELDITDGGRVNCCNTHVGYGAGSIGKVTVSGPDSTWANVRGISVITQETTPSLYIGTQGYGEMKVLDGGTVSSSFCLLGSESDGTGVVTVSGADSTWTVTERLHIGVSGNGQLNIGDGATVKSSLNVIGKNAGSTGKVSVAGPGTEWRIQRSIGGAFFRNSTLHVGQSGSGELSITDGATVRSGKSHIGYGLGSSGKVTVSGNGSTWETTGADEVMLSLLEEKNLNLGWRGNGELNLSNGGTVISRDALISSSADSTVMINVTGHGSSWKNSGDLVFGSYNSSYVIPVLPVITDPSIEIDYGIGFFEINITNGGLVQIGGKLDFNRTKTSDSFINLSTGGMLALMGEADESLDDFLNLAHDTNMIRWWDTSIDDWAMLTTATQGIDYTLDYLTDGDLTGYTRLTVGVSVPEPTTIVLLLTLLTTLGFIRRR